jgi:hypothetical protein
MAVYKVIQDVESEDKLLGPLSFKAFIYALIAGGCAFINFRLLLVGSPLKFLFIAMFLLPMILFGVLASPLGREQPTEVWLLSRIKFFLKPRKRIWDQSGLMDLVSVTVPKKQELHLTKDLSQDEVQSRLKTLATTLDTRGWAIKNVDVNLSVPEVETAQAPDSDRLVGAAGVPKQMPVVDVHAADDILDEKHNETAQKFDAMMRKADEDRRHSILATIKGLVDQPDQPKKSAKHKAERHHKITAAKGTKDLAATKKALETLKRESAAERARRRAEEDAIIAQKLEKARVSFSAEFESGRIKTNPHHRVFGSGKSASRQPDEPSPTSSTPTPVTAARQADNMELAQSGSAFSVSTLSQLANRTEAKQDGPDEVSISLH